jgi:hypothetical protein
MQRYLILAIIGFVAASPIAVAAKENIPANVTIRTGRVVDKIDWSFTPERAVDFSKLKRCVAVNLRNDELQLRDSAGSWVGPATGNYYQNSNRTTISGQGIFKIIDDRNGFLVAQGWIDKPVFAFRWIIRFDLEVALEGSAVKMVMRNINLAMSNTGSSSNDGFMDLNTYYRFRQNYATLEEAANRVKSCIVD